MKEEKSHERCERARSAVTSPLEKVPGEKKLYRTKKKTILTIHVSNCLTEPLVISSQRFPISEHSSSWPLLQYLAPDSTMSGDSHTLND